MAASCNTAQRVPFVCAGYACAQVASHAVPERFMARRTTPAGPGWEVLVKWKDLGYEHATWEVRRAVCVCKHVCKCQLAGVCV